MWHQSSTVIIYLNRSHLAAIDAFDDFPIYLMHKPLINMRWSSQNRIPTIIEYTLIENCLADWLCQARMIYRFAKITLFITNMISRGANQIPKYQTKSKKTNQILSIRVEARVTVCVTIEHISLTLRTDVKARNAYIEFGFCYFFCVSMKFRLVFLVFDLDFSIFWHLSAPRDRLTWKSY